MAKKVFKITFGIISGILLLLVGLLTAGMFLFEEEVDDDEFYH